MAFALWAKPPKPPFRSGRPGEAVAPLEILRQVPAAQNRPATSRRRFPAVRPIAVVGPSARAMMRASEMMSVLSVENLRKSFGDLVAVSDVSFAVAPGQLVGLLGPNGAGKTTTVSMIAGLVTPDHGEVRIGGRPLTGDTDLLKRRIGLVPQDLALYDELTARENLRFFGALYRLTGDALDAAIAASLELVGLTERGRDRVKSFSGGMKRRLNLAAGLLHDPDVLLLDEPTVGVDPQSRNAIFENLEILKRRGKALLYTTHYMEEAERLADRIVVLDHGRVIADDTLAGLYAGVAGTTDDRPRSLESVFLTLTGRSLRD